MGQDSELPTGAELRHEMREEIKLLRSQLEDTIKQRNYYMEEVLRAARTIPDLVEIIRLLVPSAPEGDVKERGREVLRRMPGP
jgi:hypothetical protein